MSRSATSIGVLPATCVLVRFVFSYCAIYAAVCLLSLCALFFIFYFFLFIYLFFPFATLSCEHGTLMGSTCAPQLSFLFLSYVLFQQFFCMRTGARGLLWRLDSYIVAYALPISSVQVNSLFCIVYCRICEMVRYGL